jgi:hypothetical protein
VLQSMGVMWAVSWLRRDCDWPAEEGQASVLFVLHLQGSCGPLVVGGECGSLMIPVRMAIAQVGGGKESMWVGI